jgi:hypothetical protein
MKKIVRPRQLQLQLQFMLSRRKRLARADLSTRCSSQATEGDIVPTHFTDKRHRILSLPALTAFVIDERQARQRTRARNFLWWLVQTDSPHKN